MRVSRVGGIYAGSGKAPVGLGRVGEGAVGITIR